MTLEEALNHLKNHEYWSEISIYDEMAEAVIPAVEKQIQKKPYYEGDGYDDKGELIYDTWICPQCGTKFEVDYDDYKHCPECGQKIDWSEEEL